MRTIIISILMLAMCSLAIAQDSVTVNVSQIAFLTPPAGTTDTLSGRIAIQFAIPEAIEGKMIIYAEMLGSLDFSSMSLDDEAMMDLQARGIAVAWDAEDATWSNLANQMDTLNFSSDTFYMTDSTELHMDVTPFIQTIADGGQNYGMMLIPYQFYELSVQFPQAIVNQFASNARIHIEYDNF